MEIAYEVDDPSAEKPEVEDEDALNPAQCNQRMLS
jgi:hypothetical protein